MTTLDIALDAIALAVVALVGLAGAGYYIWRLTERVIALEAALAARKEPKS